MNPKYILGVDAGGTFTDFVCVELADVGDGTAGTDGRGDAGVSRGAVKSVRVHKTLSTPAAPEEAILRGIEALGLGDALHRGGKESDKHSGGLHIIQGSTVATNALLEGKLARTAFVTNRGFGDMLQLARQTRPALYALEFAPRPPPVPPELCFETGGRLGAHGEVVQPLTEADIETLAEQVKAQAPEAVAINLLFSFLDPAFEKRIADALQQTLNEAASKSPDKTAGESLQPSKKLQNKTSKPAKELPMVERGVSNKTSKPASKAPSDTASSTAAPPVYISRSSAVLAEYKEYERGIATWLNAALGPVVGGYLDRLGGRIGKARLQVMQSSGETVAASGAAQNAVRLLLSGPAGGLTAMRFLGELLGQPRILSFDMGGTSTDVAMLDGHIRISNESAIGPYPVAVPMVDMHTIGAGGGSIAYVDSGGLLQVGPESAAAEPGPACYGRGGERPTVTDANLVLGRLPHAVMTNRESDDSDKSSKSGASSKEGNDSNDVKDKGNPENSDSSNNSTLAGGLRLDINAARRAIAQVAAPIGLSIEDTAAGIINIADELMAKAIQLISVNRGHDPADFILASFGGAGGLHVCAVAEAMGMPRALVPVNGGVLSALGMAVAERGRQFSRTLLSREDDIDPATIDAGFIQLAEQGCASLIEEGVAAADLQVSRSADMRYQGQSYTLNLPYSDWPTAAAAFHDLHRQRYGYALADPVELVNLRVKVTAPGFRFPLPKVQPGGQCNAIAETQVHGVDTPVKVYAREQLPPDHNLPGPAIITEYAATTYIAPGWTCHRDSIGNLHLTAVG